MSLIKVKSRGTDNVSGRRNIAINGAMKVAQRATSFTDISSAGYYTVDRFRVATANSAGRLTMTQETITDLPGFANAIKFACTTADTSIAAGEYLQLSQYFEGQDLQQLKKGTSSAEKVTVSFYVKGNGNATYMCELFDSDNTRHATHQFSVTSSWTRVVLTFNSDKTGAFNNDNNLSLYLSFWLHAGSTFGGGSYTANTWASNVNANRAVGASSFFSSTSNTFQITGVQMEAGSQSTQFEHEPVGTTLNKCLRYYFESKATSSKPYNYATQYQATHRFYHHWYNVPMRATPTVVTSDTGGAPSHYHPTEYHWKGYVAAAATSSNSARILTFTADAEL